MFEIIELSLFSVLIPNVDPEIARNNYNTARVTWKLNIFPDKTMEQFDQLIIRYTTDRFIINNYACVDVINC